MAEVGGGLEASSVRAQLNSREMSRAQWEVVLLCTAINMLDGYDVLVMSLQRLRLRPIGSWIPLV